MHLKPIISIMYYDGLFHYHLRQGNEFFRFALDAEAHEDLKTQQQLADSFASEKLLLSDDRPRLFELG
jgi:hypothetical protein